MSLHLFDGLAHTLLTLPFSAAVFCDWFHFPATDARYAKANIKGRR